MYALMTRFLNHSAAGSFCLMLAAAVALIWANTPLDHQYFAMRDAAHFIVNDMLMVVFFLLMGLEIKREFLAGELSRPAKALQPVFAALGGMIVPAAIFFCVASAQKDILRAWAIPCATDIPFALGVLVLLGSRVPRDLKILLTAIAILDDLGAILIIALFYTDTLAPSYFALSACGAALLFALNHFNNRHVPLYLITGCLIWFSFYKAGLHPTLAGVVTALAVPYQTEKNPVMSPLLRLEHTLHGWVSFVILPVFALVNAGLSFHGMTMTQMMQPLPSAIAAGLIFGKPLGIMGGLFLGHRLGIAVKPENRVWRDYLGLACLCGIGFTMALFIGDLAFDNPLYLNEVKLGVLSASLLSAVIGWTAARLTFIHKTS